MGRSENSPSAAFVERAHARWLLGCTHVRKLSVARNEYEQLQLVLQGPATVNDVKVAVANADVQWSV